MGGWVWLRATQARLTRRRAAAFGTFTAPAGELGIGGKQAGLKGVTRATSAVKTALLDGAVELDYGGSLEGVTVAWEEVRPRLPALVRACWSEFGNCNRRQWGDATLPPSRTVYIVPSFSNSAHVCRNLGDPSPGWWEGMVGPGQYIDTDRFRVISASNLGGPFGTTSPLSTNPATGQPYRMSFPQITPADQARVHRRLLQHLGLEEVHSMIGSSMGGMIALQFASLFPSFVKRLGVTACTAKTTPGTVARRRVQRRAIVADPDFLDGNYASPSEDGPWPHSGMKVAREIGMICYRSREEFDQRFAWSVGRDQAIQEGSTLHPLVEAHFDVEKYMEWMGKKFAKARYDPCCYLLQSRSMDLMDLGFESGSYAEGALRIDAERIFACGILQDELIPSRELQSFAELLATRQLPELDGGAGAVEDEPMDSLYGHDAFFKVNAPPWVSLSPVAVLMVANVCSDVMRAGAGMVGTSTAEADRG